MTPLMQTASISAGQTVCGPHPPGLSEEEAESEYTLVFPTSGYFVRHVGSERTVAAPTVVLLISRGDVQRVSHPGGGGDECLFVALTPEFVDPFLDSRTDRFPVASVVNRVESDLTLRQLVRHAHRGQGCELGADETVSRLLSGFIAGNRGRPSGSSRHRALVADAEEFLAAHYALNWGLPDLARAVGSSPHHLSRVFRDVTGVTISAYRTQLRVRAAVHQISEGARDLHSVALDTGFYDHAHMANALRRHIGKTPSAIRRLLDEPVVDPR